jgi:hypothetical protein
MVFSFTSVVVVGTAVEDFSLTSNVLVDGALDKGFDTHQEQKRKFRDRGGPREA